MRKLSALLLAWLFICLAGSKLSAQTSSPDVANFTFVVTAPNNNVVFTNTSTLGAEPGERQAVWTFGDGNSATTGPLQGTQHTYQTAGTYTVCLKIYRRSPNGTAPVLSAQICKTVVIETTCRANFESPGTTSSPTGRYFVAIPGHNENKKPVRICWNFGDGRDTCIQYPASHTGAYAVFHQYAQPGTYNVCVNILYDGGCQATKCNTITITEPDNCRADFERIQVSPTVNPLHATFKALPWHNNNKKPVRICWTFGDGRDTCIQYSNTFAGPYTVNHLYTNPGQYEVCVKILYEGGCEARKCKPMEIGRPDSCRANFEKLPVTTASNPLTVIYKAFPWHNNNKKPARICWTFGDGRDTCINYLNIYNGQYTVPHTYSQPGQYEVCVKIFYYGGCEARKCEPVRVGTTDSCGADFERVPVLSGNNPLQTYFKALPSHNNNKKPSRICWTFGDGRDTCINYTENYTGLYGVSHTYNQPGRYEVCVKIQYFGGCEARKCRLVEIIRPDICQADFERIPVLTTNNPLHQYFKALPSHNNNRKPARICWTFGDGRDTCINYPETYTGQYGVSHTYNQPGAYEVCVKIQYFGGCEARKCKLVEIIRPDICQADFEKIPVLTTNNPLHQYFKALPSHNNNRKPAKICWNFGDGRDTCINYPETYTGQYGVSHTYTQPGAYEVCVKIQYFGGCEARKCRLIEIPRPDSCRADFERLQATAGTSPLSVGFKALPWHNNDKKPVRICWQFGDGRDTCITYPPNYTGPYGVLHTYTQPGQYEVCVKILYAGGCEARKCRMITVPPPQPSCSVNLFEIAPSITSLVRGFLAVPHTEPVRRPQRICWIFGDGEDTCIMIDPQQPLPDLTIRHQYPAPGVYRACVKILFEGGCIAESCREVVIRAASNLCGGYMTDSLTGPRTYKFKGFSIHNPGDEVLSYRWTFGDGSSATGREVSHTYNQGGSYQVCLTIITRSGCETRICKTVRVPGSNAAVLYLTPNPVVTVMHVAFLSTHTEPVNIRILNGFGTVVRNYTRTVTTGPNNWDVDLALLMPGIYTFIIQSPNQLASALFIKQ